MKFQFGLSSVLSLVFILGTSTSSFASSELADVVAPAGSYFQIKLSTNAPVAQSKLNFETGWIPLETSDDTITVFNLPKGDSTVVFTTKFNPAQPFFNRISVINMAGGPVGYVTSADIGSGQSTVIELFGE